MRTLFIQLEGEGWETNGTTSVIGSAFRDGKLASATELLHQIEDRTVSSAREPFAEWNGFWAAAHETDGEVLLAVDQIRSHPLYYATTEDSIYISDDAHWIRSQIGGESIASEDALEYLLTGYVTGSETLCPSIKQVPAGKSVAIDLAEENAITSYQYYTYLPSRADVLWDERALLDEYDRVMANVGRRLVEYADDRPIVVSLTAGYDSRLIATTLSRIGYENTIALTFSYQENEVDRARSTADHLGLETIYIDQTHVECREWYQSNERRHLDRHAGWLDACPPLNNAVALSKARADGTLPDDAVIVTGDTASTTGEHITKPLFTEQNPTQADLVTAILDFHYTLWPWSADLEPILRKRIRRTLENDPFTDRSDILAAFERWDWRERQAKHIPLIRNIEFYGFDWWSPLWDREYMAFWNHVPTRYRYDRRLHETYVERVFRNTTGLDHKTASETFHRRNPMVDRVAELVTGTQLESVATDVYRQWLAPLEYEDNPLFGIMSEEQFDTLMTTKQSIHAFRVLDVLDVVSFEPRDDGAFPAGGTITRDWVENRFGPLSSGPGRETRIEATLQDD